MKAARTNEVERKATSFLNDLKNDPEYFKILTFAFSAVFDEIKPRIYKGELSPHEKEWTLVHTTVNLYHKLSNLRRLNYSLDCFMSNSELTNESPPSNTVETAMDTSYESESVDVPKGSTENNCIPNFDEKITCVCNICQKRIDVISYDVEYYMKSHLDSAHPELLSLASFNSDIKNSENDPTNDAGESGNVDIDNGELESNSSDSSHLFVSSAVPVNKTNETDFIPSVYMTCKDVLKQLNDSKGLVKAKKDAYVCFLCDMFLPIEKFIHLHLKSARHRINVRKYREYSEEVKINHIIEVDPNMFTIKEGKLNCVDCVTSFSQQHDFFVHLKNHDQKIKLDFPIVKIGKFDFCALCDVRIKNKENCINQHLRTKQHFVKYLEITPIIQLKNVKFCSLCNSELFTEFEYETHLNSEIHTYKVERICNLIDDEHLDLISSS